MATSNFYVQTTGADINAGSTTSNGAVYTSTSGNWSTVTNIFTPTDGSTPASTVSVGDWVSLYIDAATVAVYVAQVTVVAAGVNGAITVSATVKMGTAPTTNSGARSLKAGGAWASEQAFVTLGSSTVAVNTKINIKAGTYSVGASRTINLQGTAALLLWFSGYNTTPGDLDNDTTNALAKPVIAMGGTFTWNAAGNFQQWTGLSFTGSVNNFVFLGNGTPQYVGRCRFENTNAGANAGAYTTGSNRNTIAYSWFKAPATCTGVGVARSSSGTFVGCVATGGGLAAFESQANNSAGALIQCAAVSPTGNGFRFGGNTSILMLNCTVGNSSSDAVAITGTPPSNFMNMIVGCLFSTVTGWGINNSSGTNTTIVLRACNDTYLCSSGAETGFGDAPNFFPQADGSNPLASSSNFSVVAGVLARANGFPGIFENATPISYVTCGAADPQTGSGTGGEVSTVFCGA